MSNIEIIMRQTNYSKQEAEEKLKKHHPNCTRDGKNEKTRSKLTYMR